MSGTVHFITHPEVMVDPAVPVPRWGLAEVGIRRMRALAAAFAAAGVRPAAVWASTEAKAIEGAGLLAARFGLGVRVLEELGENDRSATGYLPPPEFQAMADAFFARPEESVRGWERAVDAQARIVAAVRAVRAESPAGDLAIVAHGGVGALLRAWLAGAPISRSWDQPAQGHRFAFPRGESVSGTFPWVALPGPETAPAA
ncbi:histidine phosphatase family protein [Muricoccus radiodurans]|uniref:histidine phosphatase family protein n=1 Tax=Muricoccus radiodurans TaxID=2231721 RepID=UPI003CEFE220